MTFSWFNTMEKKKKKRAPYFHHRMSADDLRQKIIELKSRGVTNQIICKDLQIGGSTLYKFLREEGTIRKYLKLKEYADSKGLPIHEISRLVTGGKNRFSRDFKDGKFKFFAPGDIEETDKNLENMEAVSSLIKRYVFTNNKFVDQKKFRVALYSFLRRKDVNVEKFMNKLTVKSDSIHPCHDSRGYYIMFRDIYNYNNRNPLTEEQV